MSKSVGSTEIPWTHATWNPTTGCTKISQGCKHCYAETMTKRLQGMKRQTKYGNGFKLTMHEQSLEEPLSWCKPRKPKLVFVNSMSDLFHKDVTDDFIKRTFDVMKRSFRYQFQVLTKRSERLAEISGELKWSWNIWMGVSVESAETAHRIEDLRKTKAQVKFLSIEPMLGPFPEVSLEGIDWIIVGGESGPGARPMKAEWVRDVRDRCIEQDIPFFFKQWGGVRRRVDGEIQRTLDGRIWEEMPDQAEKTFGEMCSDDPDVIAFYNSDYEGFIR